MTFYLWSTKWSNNWAKGGLMSRRGDNIRKRVDGRWEGRYRCQNEKGGYKYRSVYGKTYRDVKEKLTSISIDKQREAVPLDKESNEIKLSFGVIMEEWLELIQQTRKHSTYVKYHSIYKCHIKYLFYDIPVIEINIKFVNEKLQTNKAGKELSQSMKYSILAVMNQALHFAAEKYNCPVIYLKHKMPKKKNKPVEILNRTEQSRLIPYLYSDLDRSKAGIILCISTGLRLGEICSLKWEDIDFDQMVIHVNRTVQRIAMLKGTTKTMLIETMPKSQFSVREIPISDTTRQLLSSFKVKGQEYVLSGDKPMEPRTYQNHFKKYLKEINVNNHNFHALRHTFATNCIESGMDVKSLSEILGHSDIQITLNHYVHPTMDTKRKHINMLSSVYGQYCGLDLQGNSK